jgi:hypothetical protein
MDNGGSAEYEGSLYGKRWKEFEISRDYANGTQNTSIYKQILTSLDPNNGDGSLVNLDWTPVPIVPKFVKIVVNKILSSKFYPNVEAVDPLSRSEKDYEKNKMKVFIENKDVLKEAKETGLRTEVDPDALPDTAEEPKSFLRQTSRPLLKSLHRLASTSHLAGTTLTSVCSVVT